jgi:pilus assembly protein CpaD
MTEMKQVLRFGALAAVLLAGSCASPTNDAGVYADGTVNHPIVVQPNYESIKLPFSVSNQGLMPEDSAKLASFVNNYRMHGNGSISVSAPAGPNSDVAIHYFGDRLAEMGVPASKILVGTHDVTGGDTRIELGYVGYVAHVDPCGDWSENLGDTSSNLPGPDFGCSVQHNIAAQVADPRDLIEPRALGNSDVVRRAGVMDKYEKGQITQADKNKADKSDEQSGTSSDVH